MTIKAKILITDDDHLVREAVVKILQMFGYEVEAASSGEEALDLLRADFDAIILDINMPGMDGFETMAAIKEKDYGIPVLFLTGAGSMEYAVKAINLGAYDFISKPIEDLDLFNVKIHRAVEKRMYVQQERVYKEKLEIEVRNKTRELAEKNVLLEEYSNSLEVSAVNTITTLQVALEEKDQYTAGHTTRVTEYSSLIAKAMQVSSDDLAVLQRACRMHDIGKLVIDNSCIRKPGPLTDEEWQLVRKHPEIGQNIIKPLGFLGREGEIVRHHHERLDGKGYPDGISGDDICHLTRIITVADSFDAMTSKRSYKTNMSRQEGIDELRRCVGTQFDPGVVKVFAEVLSKSKQTRVEAL
ncbi:MAG: response regulator [Proteobacteria bacterium]|nr:response regulator [Pseudomonadota bacterium]MBU1687035.1 response regulator [Pseudomonadota bacterium]